jgi:hypothetical protein
MILKQAKEKKFRILRILSSLAGENFGLLLDLAG